MMTGMQSPPPPENAARAAVLDTPGLRIQRWWAGLDQPIFFAVLGLFAAGAMLAAAASPGAAARLALDNPYYFVQRHLAAMGVAIIVLIAVSALSPARLRLFFMGLLAASVVALGVTLVAGVEVNGARRWLALGALRMQPVEFLKPALVVAAAWALTSGRGASAGGDPAASAVVLGLAAASLALLAAQPDVGQALLVAALVGAVLFLAGAPAVWLGAAAVIAGGLAFAGYQRFAHVRARVDDFLAGGGETSFQAERARAAFSEGGVFGVGPGESAVTPQLPDAQGDYVLAVAAEEYGAVFVLAMIALTGFIVVRTVLRADRAADATARVAAAGLGVLLGLQAIVNMAVNMDLAPPKGMTLPFVSYGGSSLAASGLAAGAILGFLRPRDTAGAATHRQSNGG